MQIYINAVETIYRNMTYSLLKRKKFSVDDLPELDEIWILPHYEKQNLYETI